MDFSRFETCFAAGKVESLIIELIKTVSLFSIVLSCIISPLVSFNINKSLNTKAHYVNYNK